MQSFYYFHFWQGSKLCGIKKKRWCFWYWCINIDFFFLGKATIQFESDNAKRVLFRINPFKLLNGDIVVWTKLLCIPSIFLFSLLVSRSATSISYSNYSSKSARQWISPLWPKQNCLCFTFLIFSLPFSPFFLSFRTQPVARKKI